ncbi:CBS domain-containing protein [Chloroflexota bacterium]
MLVQDVMTRKVITVTMEATAVDALKIMKEHNFSRLPVVDDKGRLVGLVNDRRLERIKPPTSTPRLLQITYLLHQLSQTTVGKAMRKRIVTVKPMDTVEYAIAKAQSNKVGAVIVVDGGNIVGICTTNDFFYKIVNPTLGIGESGAHLFVEGAGDGKSAEEIIGTVNRMGVRIKVIWTSYSSKAAENDLTLHLDIEDASEVINKLAQKGYNSTLRNTK